MPPLQGIAGPRGPAPAHDVAPQQALAPQGRLGDRHAEPAEAQPRAGLIDRAWAAISQFVRVVRGIFGRAEPAPSQPRAGAPAAAEVGPAASAPAAAARGLNVTGTLQGEAANRFAADALRLGSAQQAETRTADGICALAAKDWPRGTLIIDGQTSDHDLARSVALVDRLTGGDAQMKMKVSQYVNQGSLMALQTAMSRGDLGNRTAAGAALVPLGGFNYTYTLAADEGGGIRLTFDASMSRLQGMTNAEDGSLLETDPERSSGTFSFGLRIAPDLGVSVAQPLSYSLQTQPLD